MSSDFESIATEFRDIFVDPEGHSLGIRAIPPDDPSDPEPDPFTAPNWVYGGRFYPEMDGEMRTLDLYVVGPHATIAGRFHKAGAQAGAMIPNRIRDAIYDLWPTTAFAWWMSAVWKFSTIEPEISLPWSPERPEECGGLYIRWDDPIASFLSTLEAANLIGPGPQHVMATGEWSVPMSRTEFARRILEKPTARPRDVELIFDQYDKTQIGSNTWTFRLDTLPPATRKKLEGGKQ